VIEVEIRGQLTENEHQKLKAFMAQHGRHTDSHEREMYLLFDYPGYDPDPTLREVDIRLRNTNGFCEIMVKRRAGDGNAARHELSLPLQVKDLTTAKEVLRALGCTKGIKMQRTKDVYEYSGIEWSLVKTPKNYFYYEAEQAVEVGSDVDAVRTHLAQAASQLGLPVLDNDSMREFIEMLDREVNEVVEL
jgi:adenylate cyclase class IV